jgi:hypothetical protein
MIILAVEKHLTAPVAATRFRWAPEQEGVALAEFRVPPSAPGAELIATRVS